jgi:DNA-nicking Smr family endonuclease
MTRRLAPDEQALWELVAATVKPLHPARPTPRPPAPESAAAPPPPRSLAGPRRAPRAPAAPALPDPPSSLPPGRAETLDAAWDRRLASANARPDMVIDLHGLRRETARHLLYSRVADAEARGLRLILVITGKGHDPGPSPADLMEGRPARGAIRADLPRWLGEQGLSARIAAVRRAHPRHGGAGAAWLVLKRKRA